MASPKRDQYQPGAGKLLKDDDSVLDVTAILTKIDAVLSAVTGLKVNADINVGDIEIGAVELKNGTTDARATINAVNTARTTADIGLVTQEVDPAGTTTTNVTAGADAVSNTRTDKPTSSRLSGFNGSTWDRIRAGITTIGSTFTGFLNSLPWAIYHATRTARTDGQGGPLESNANGDLSTTEGTRRYGEDEARDAQHFLDTGAATRITTATTTACRNSSGSIRRIIVKAVLTGTVSIYNHPSTASNLIDVLPVGLAVGSYNLGYDMSNGVVVVTSAADNITIVTDR